MRFYHCNLPWLFCLYCFLGLYSIPYTATAVRWNNLGGFYPFNLLFPSPYPLRKVPQIKINKYATNVLCSQLDNLLSHPLNRDYARGPDAQFLSSALSEGHPVAQLLHKRRRVHEYPKVVQ